MSRKEASMHGFWRGPSLWGSISGTLASTPTLLGSVTIPTTVMVSWGATWTWCRRGRRRWWYLSTLVGWRHKITPPCQGQIRDRLNSDTNISFLIGRKIIPYDMGSRARVAWTMNSHLGKLMAKLRDNVEFRNVSRSRQETFSFIQSQRVFGGWRHHRRYSQIDLRIRVLGIPLSLVGTLGIIRGSYNT